MPALPAEPADKPNNIEDLSGINTAAYANPYDALIHASGGDAVKPHSCPQHTTVDHYTL
jgi:hypothetical protein